MITTISELSRKEAVLAGLETSDHRASEAAADAGQHRAEEEGHGEDHRDVDAKGRDHLAIVDPRPDDHPGRVRLSQTTGRHPRGRRRG